MPTAVFLKQTLAEFEKSRTRMKSDAE